MTAPVHLLAILGLIAALPLAVLGSVGLLCLWGLRVPRGTWDLIAVPGAAVYPGGVPSPALRRRVELAVRLWGEGRAPVILMTGGVGRHPPAEADVAAELARALGVPDAAILREGRSTTTDENARLAREVAGPGAVLVVTDLTHALRATLTFRRHFDRADGVGAPQPRGVLLRAGVRELGALAAYAVRGRLRLLPGRRG